MRLVYSALFLIFMTTSTLATDEWTVTTLDNGLKVMIREYHQVPQVNISTTVKVGAKNETAFYDGATHLLEHLILFRGTEKMSGEEVGEAMKKHGAYFNGYTSQDWTDFVISLPREHLEFALSIHADMLFRSDFSSEAMDEERQAVLEEINISEDRPQSKVYRTMLGQLFKGHPYEKNVLGTKERVSNVPRDSVYTYYKRYYAPNNMTMVIVGDLDAASTLQLVKKYFDSFPRGELPVDQYHPPQPLREISRLEIKKDVNQAYLQIGMVGPKSDSPDQYAVDLMATILGSGETSRLWKRLKDELGIVYSTSFEFYTSKYEGPVMASAVLEPKNLALAEEKIREILVAAKTDGFTDEELLKAKNNIRTRYYINHERGLDMADSYAQYDSFIGYEFIQNYPEMIEKTSLAEVNAAARRYLETDNYTVTTVVPQ